MKLEDGILRASYFLTRHMFLNYTKLHKEIELISKITLSGPADIFRTIKLNNTKQNDFHKKI